MGIMYSFFARTENKLRPRSLVELQQSVVDYLLNGDYKLDPHATFLIDVERYGYNSLENFIKEIPSDFTDIKKDYISPDLDAEQHEHNLELVNEARIVFKDDPSKRAIIANSNEENPNLVVRVNEKQQSYFKVLNLFIGQLRWILGTFFPRVADWIFGPPLLKVLPSDIQPEKNYLRQFLNIPVPIYKEIGTFKGLHGGNNSCYLDSLLFALFYCTDIFDSILKYKDGETKFSRRTRRILKRDIVEPLRQSYYCPFENVMKLRRHLGKMNETILGSFMDVEEIFYVILQDVLQEKEYIKYADVGEGWGDFMHLMCIVEDDPLKVITVQKNVEISFKTVNQLTLDHVPSPAFILGMPRSDRKLVHYEYVIPNLELDISDLIKKENCSCEREATIEMTTPGSDTPLPICDKCLNGIDGQQIAKAVSRKRMKLLAIICIRAAHFTCFSYSNYSKQWLYFDSMAGGYPEVTPVPDLPDWLNKLAADMKSVYNYKETEIPIQVERAIKDGHWCIYEPINIK